MVDNDYKKVMSVMDWMNFHLDNSLSLEAKHFIYNYYKKRLRYCTLSEIDDIAKYDSWKEFNTAKDVIEYLKKKTFYIKKYTRINDTEGYLKDNLKNEVQKLPNGHYLICNII